MKSLAYYFFPSLLFLYLLRIYREKKWGKCENKEKLDGKVAIVTGANSGIGYEIAKELASRNAQVIMACRDMDKARAAVNNIKRSIYTNPVIVAMELDLASLRSIKSFAQRIIKNYPSIDILVNNAGVSFPKTKRVETKDGFEVHFGVNYLGHFYLTTQLLDLLSKTPSRVVIIASSLHEKGQIDLEDLNSLKSTSSTNLYANSKLANVYFCKELARRIKDTPCHVYACCPGWVYTGLFKNSIKWYHYILVAPIAFFFMRTPYQGSQTPIFCATEPSLLKETGLIYRECKVYNSKFKFEDKVANNLWEKSDQMIKNIMGSTSSY